MAKIIFTRGIPASGKTTWSKAYILEDPEHRIRINWDDIRNMLGKYWVPSREDIVNASSVSILQCAMAQGYDVVIDNMNLSEKSRAPFMEVINEFNTNLDNERYDIEFKDFKTPLEVCIERDSKRENPITEKTIRSIYNRNKDFYNK